LPPSFSFPRNCGRSAKIDFFSLPIKTSWSFLSLLLPTPRCITGHSDGLMSKWDDTIFHIFAKKEEAKKGDR
jgi:hypothetical protein